MHITRWLLEGIICKIKLVITTNLHYFDLSFLKPRKVTFMIIFKGITEPLCVFMRLAEGLVLPNTMEVPIPVRFIFLLLTPDTLMSASYIDPHEVGRSFSTMMSNPVNQ